MPVVVPNFRKLGENTKTISEALKLLSQQVEPCLQPQVQMYVRIQQELESVGLSEETQKAILSDQKFLQKLKPGVLDIPDEISNVEVFNKYEVNAEASNKDDGSPKRDWQPKGMFYQSEMHKVRGIVNKNDVVRKKDADNGRFSKSAFERAKNSLRDRPAASLDKKIFEKKVSLRHDPEIYELVPRVEIDPKTSIGVTFVNARDVSAGVKGNHEDVHAYAGASLQLGVNLGTAQTQTEYYDARADVGGPTLQLDAKANFEFNRNNIDLSAEFGGIAVACALKEEIVGKIEFSSFTLKIKVEAEAIAGAGITGRVGYKTYQKGGGSFYFGCGAADGVGLGARLRIEVVPKIQEIKPTFN